MFRQFLYNRTNFFIVFIYRMKRLIQGRRIRIRGNRIEGHKQVQGGSLLQDAKPTKGQRDDLFRQEAKENQLPKGELGQQNMDSTIKRNLLHKKQYLGNITKKAISGGTMMDPLESVRLPKFVGGKKMNRNNIKISL